MAESSAPRSYHSPRREEAARATQRAVIDAAHRLFVAKGYTATTIDDIAQTANVSRPTVFGVGTKPELLKLVRDVAIAGDDEPVAVLHRRPYAEMEAAPDPEATLRLHARNVVAISQRYAEIDQVLSNAASSAPELRQLWEASEEQRHTGAGIVIDNILSKGSLGADIDRRHAIDVLWLLMAPDHFLRMRRQGWEPAEYEAWLADTFVELLLH